LISLTSSAWSPRSSTSGLQRELSILQQTPPSLKGSPNLPSLSGVSRTFTDFPVYEEHPRNKTSSILTPPHHNDLGISTPDRRNVSSSVVGPRRTKRTTSLEGSIENSSVSAEVGAVGRHSTRGHSGASANSYLASSPVIPAISEGSLTPSEIPPIVGQYPISNTDVHAANLLGLQDVVRRSPRVHLGGGLGF
jgi:hypothetical protein